MEGFIMDKKNVGKEMEEMKDKTKDKMEDMKDKAKDKMDDKKNKY